VAAQHQLLVDEVDSDPEVIVVVIEAVVTAAVDVDVADVVLQRTKRRNGNLSPSSAVSSSRAR
jgi:hypothetical protein